MRGMREETIQRIRDAIDRIAEGATLRRAAASEGLSTSTFHDGVSSVRELASRYAQAQAIQAHTLVDEMRDIADDPTLDPQDKKVRVDTRRWIASKLNPQYSDRVDVRLQGELSVLGPISDAAARSMRDLSPVIDAQVVDTPSVSVSYTSDSISEDAPPALPCELPGQLE